MSDYSEVFDYKDDNPQYQEAEKDYWDNEQADKERFEEE